MKWMPREPTLPWSKELKAASGMSMTQFSRVHGVSLTFLYDCLRVGHCPWPLRPHRGRLEKHPLFRTWQFLTKREPICEAWHDFGTFISDVGLCPSGNHTIARRDAAAPHGPGNTVWVERTRKEA